MEVSVGVRLRRPGWEWAAILGGGLVGLVLLSLYLNDISDRPVRNIDWNTGLTLGFLGVACGAVAWHRRPDTPIGRRMVIAGFLVYAEMLLRSNNSWLFSLGNLVAGASAALLIHIVVTYPSGRCETVLERIVVVSGYAFVVVFPVARAATTDFGPTCFRCPVNRFYVGGYPNVFDVLDHVSVAVVVVIVAMMTAVLAAKWRRSGRAARRVLAPSYASALLIVAVVLVARPDFDIRGTSTAGETAVDLALLTFPLALAFGLLRGHLARAAASDLLVDLGVDSDLGAAAARALDDPTARLYTWDAASSSFRDNDGARYAIPSGSGRRLVVVERDGRRLAALDHDAALADEPERLSAVVSAVGLALDRARLAEEVQAQLAEVASSRSRIVVAADRERRRIERNLHDGAQQRLVGASMLLRRARTRALSDGGDDLAALLAQAADEIDRSLREIRELARGLQPPLLEERGLLAALDSLVETTPLPATVEGHLDHRPPTAVEAAAFFVVSECLANAGKHAAATRVVITVDQVDGDLVLAVADNGTGGAVITHGAGLDGFRDRVEALDGTIDVCSVPQAGTTITVRLPLVSPMSATVTATVLVADRAGDGVEGVDEHGWGNRIVIGHGGTITADRTEHLTATFPSVMRALDAAVALQQAAYRTEPRQLLRIGISTGEIDTDDDGVHGTAVSEAGRLCALAETGAILAGPVVHLLAGTRAGHTLRSQGPISLPGLPQPIEVSAVEWQPREDEPLRIVLADDAPVIREGIAALFRDAGLHVVASVADADALLAAVASHHPDVAITDIRMPPTHGLEGLEAALTIRTSYPDVAVLVLSQHIETGSAAELLTRGARSIGYLLKERVGDVDELTNALHHLVAGGTVIDPEIVARLVDRPRTADPLAALTDREREVLGLMAEGRTNQAIATTLHVNAKTVESHVRSIFTKLNLEPELDAHRRVLAVITFLRSDHP